MTFVISEGGEDVSLVRSAKGDAHRQRELVPSKVVRLSKLEGGALGGEEDLRGIDIQNVGA